MRGTGSIVGVACGVILGTLGTMFYLGSPRTVGAASNDRFGDYIMATGAVSINPRVQTDGVWLLDYRSGKLLGSVIDKVQGKIVGWAEVDLTNEFGVKALQDVHFMMTTGYVTQGQSALYVAETSTGKFGVYTMGPGTNGQGIVIRRHDMTSFRNVEPAGAAGITPATPGFTPGAPTLGASPMLGSPIQPAPAAGIPAPTSPTLPPSATPVPGGGLPVNNGTPPTKR